jgi:hypothetical protein
MLQSKECSRVKNASEQRMLQSKKGAGAKEELKKNRYYCILPVT